jgi:DNA topoisomerase-2
VPTTLAPDTAKTTLILTEGDSAKTLAVAGLGVVGRDNFGVFPLRGKLLNIREAKHDQIMKNEEIQDIKKIMGLHITRITRTRVHRDTEGLC